MPPDGRCEMAAVQHGNFLTAGSEAASDRFSCWWSLRHGTDR